MQQILFSTDCSGSVAQACSRLSPVHHSRKRDSAIIKMMLLRTHRHVVFSCLLLALLSDIAIDGTASAFVSPGRSRTNTRTKTLREPSSATASSTTTSRFMFDFLKGKGDDSSSSPPKVAEAIEEDGASDFSDDPVDKLFSLFFGKKEEAPMGMKRFGRGAFVKRL